ncbi:hypothetical protein T265_03593 [Opisthorchis viverrini]|uniref:Uncharacterized protein n=1 Tax=Opisthorchis viverrini TaxID=6198 RepID=A0A074ZR65_OPIVI|nr:hypothetical protein T265_03593 [Opisthorchis viverrini]KER29903.1 hypothetical protein T265_03593 [Opisthorchis viverrini]
MDTSVRVQGTSILKRKRPRSNGPTSKVKMNIRKPSRATEDLTGERIAGLASRFRQWKRKQKGIPVTDAAVQCKPPDTLVNGF